MTAKTYLQIRSTHASMLIRMGPTTEEPKTELLVGKFVKTGYRRPLMNLAYLQISKSKCTLYSFQHLSIYKSTSKIDNKSSNMFQKIQWSNDTTPDSEKTINKFQFVTLFAAFYTIVSSVFKQSSSVISNPCWMPFTQSYLLI